MTIARSQTVFPEEIQLLHIWCRAVRRSFLCGYDDLLKRNYEHRREWLLERFKFCAGIYAIDIVTFAIMGNHYHLLVRTRADIVAAMTDEEVVRNILRLDGDFWYFPDGRDRKKIYAEINRRTSDRKWLKRARLRLSNVSKMMQSINQSIARRANKEDGVKGRFFEARFGHEVLADVPDVLACAMYIDLNPVRANQASTPEESEYTGVYERVNDLRMFVAKNRDGTFRIGASQSGEDVHRWERLGEGESGWLSPLSIDERQDPVGPDRSKPVGVEPRLRRRASNKGVFAMSLLEYLELLDFSGRRQRPDKRGVVEESVPPVLERLGFDFEHLAARVEYLAVSHSLYFDATERQGRPDAGTGREGHGYKRE